MSNTKDKKIRHLFLSLLFDGIGMLSYVIPGLGEVSDMIWAPISAWIMTRMYKGKIGQAAGLVTFVEELVPGLDFIPTFTIMWFYTYVLSKPGSKKVIKSK